MRKYAFLFVFILAVAMPIAAMAAPGPTLLEVAQVLSPGGNTIGGPGIFGFQPNQSVNVMDLSSSTSSVCASVLLISGRVDISVKDVNNVVIESSTANATPGPGGITSGATACADDVALVEVKCSSSSTEPCRGAWRADKK